MRDFTYVNDTVAGVLAAMDYTPLQCGEVYNIGSGHPSPLHTMLEGLQRELNTTSTTVCYTLYQHSTVCYTVPDQHSTVCYTVPVQHSTVCYTVHIYALHVPKP